MNRKEKALQHINPDGFGIEIGPCNGPIASKREGYKVHIIDHLSREELIAKYTEHQLVDLDKIEEVDYVWRGEGYAALTGKSKYYDWIIASHVIEHMPDLIGFLNDCDAILKDDGVISLVVPDKRYCFDHYQPVSSISKVIDSHLQKNTIHSPGSVAEHMLNIVSKAGKTSWDSSTTGEYDFVHSLDLARQLMDWVIKEKGYVDVHTWYFVPYSFRLMIHDLFCFGLIPFQEVGFFPTEGCEFFITVGRKGKGISRSRLEMLDIIESEIREDAPVPETSINISKGSIKRRWPFKTAWRILREYGVRVLAQETVNYLRRRGSQRGANKRG